jgi:hypothetical protein
VAEFDICASRRDRDVQRLRRAHAIEIFAQEHNLAAGGTVHHLFAAEQSRFSRGRSGPRFRILRSAAHQRSRAGQQGPVPTRRWQQAWVRWRVLRAVAVLVRVGPRPQQRRRMTRVPSPLWHGPTRGLGRRRHTLEWPASLDQTTSSARGGLEGEGHKGQVPQPEADLGGVVVQRQVGAMNQEVQDPVGEDG